jgi:hypothetical protein
MDLITLKTSKLLAAALLSDSEVWPANKEARAAFDRP